MHLDTKIEPSKWLSDLVYENSTPTLGKDPVIPPIGVPFSASETCDADGTVHKKVATIKIANFPWEISKSEIVHFLSGCCLVSDTKVHIPIDKTTGKTRNEAFVELREDADVDRCVISLNRKYLKGRMVSVQPSDFSELFHVHFPLSDIEQQVLLTKDEINSLLLVCKNFKVHFSRRCAQRPYEHVCSLLYLLPWKQMNVVNRDAIFEMVKQALEFLLNHLNRPLPSLGAETLNRFLKAIYWFPVFTDRQRKITQQMCEGLDKYLQVDAKIQRKLNTLAINSMGNSEESLEKKCVLLATQVKQLTEENEQLKSELETLRLSTKNIE